MIAIAIIYVALAYVIAPVALFLGWKVCASVIHSKSVLAWIALVSLILATASAALAIGTLMEGPWKFYDPTLMNIYRIGFFTSLAALIFGLGAIWKRTELRWYAPLASLGTLVFWLGAAAME